MKKKFMYLLLIIVCFSCFTEVKAKMMYFLVNCEESRRNYKLLTGKNLTRSGGYWIDDDKITDEISFGFADSGSTDGCGPSASSKFACSFGCIGEAINNVGSGNTYVAESMGTVLNVLKDSGLGNAVGSKYCVEVCTDKKKFIAPLDNSVVAKQGTRFNWLNSEGHILTLKNERNCTVAFDYSSWKNDYNSAKNTIESVNEKLKNPSKKAYCPYGYSYIGGGKCSNDERERKIDCGSNYYYSSDDGTYAYCRMTDNYKKQLKNSREAAIKQINTLIDNAKSCYNYVSPDYTACNDVEISYGDEVYGSILAGDKDAKKLVKSGGGRLTSNVAQSMSVSATVYSSCSETSCSSHTVYFNILNSTRKLTYNSSYNWDLQDDLFRCVGIDGYSFLRCDLALKNSGNSNYFGQYKNFIKLSSSNFPVNFNSTPTTHPITIHYNCDGASNNTCNYSVVECVGNNCPDQTCDPSVEDCGGNNGGNNNGSIDLIYRVINLNNPFPNRTPGYNWNVGSYVKDYITNNRNVTTEEVFTKEPMYEIELTPVLIKEIRNSNKNVNYGDLDLYCKDGNECRSKFVRELSDNGYLSGCGTNNSFDYCKVGDV